MANRLCDHWLKLGSTEYDVFLVESLKFGQCQFAQVLVTRESTYRVCLLARMIALVLETCARMLKRARECSYSRVHSSASVNLH